MADLHLTVTEAGINGAIVVLMRHAPFFFNYAFPTIKPIHVDPGGIVGYEDDWIACHDVPFSPIPGVPRFRRLPPMLLPGLPIQMPYCLQVTRAVVDLHPGALIDLPPQLDPPIPDQAFAVELEVSFGFACIPERKAAAIVRSPGVYAMVHREQPPVLPVKKLLCSKLRVVAVAHLEVETITLADGSKRDDIRAAVDNLEIVDIRPTGLENALECYLRAMLAAWVLPTLLLKLKPLVVKTLGVKTIQTSLEPGHPHNPTIEQDTLQAWLDVAIT